VPAAATPAGSASRPAAPADSAAATSTAASPQGRASRQGAAAGARRKRSRREATPRRGSGGGLRDLLPVGQRPPAPWHPLPLSELLILIGAIGTVVGLSRGLSNGGPPLIAGLAAVAIGTVEVTLREHLSGYRSHTIVLAVLPVIVLDSVLVLLIAPFGAPVKLAMLVLDAALVTFLYRLLRARFLDARRERVFTEGR
jgi:hypothetical protein